MLYLQRLNEGKVQWSLFYLSLRGDSPEEGVSQTGKHLIVSKQKTFFIEVEC